MADFGFEGTWKTELGVIVESAISSGADTPVDIGQGLNFPDAVIAINTTAGNSSGFSDLDPLTITAPDLPGGVQAAGHVLSAAGAIDSAVVTQPGSGYTSPPTVTAVTGGTQGTATLIAEIGSDTAGVTYITCIITTDDPLRIEVGGVSTALSFAIVAGDKFTCTLSHNRPIGLWGDGATPDVTIQRVII